MSEQKAQALRTAFGTYMTGVTVVTARNEAGVPVGFTANSFSSVSLNPPLLLVCPANTLTCMPVFAGCSHFAVNVLAEHQRELANTFASRSDDRFADFDYTDDAGGCPIFSEVAAHFSCAAAQRVSAGDHTILIGEVLEFSSNSRAGLGYSRNGYFSLQLERMAAGNQASAGRHFGGVIVERDAKVLVCDQEELQLPQVPCASGQAPLPALQGALVDSGLDLSFGPVYSVFQAKGGERYSFYRATSTSEQTPDGYRWLPLSSLQSIAFSSPAVTKMMLRYVQERGSGNFKLYVGDEFAGDVHQAHEDVQL
ncbi:MAG: flavin reductase family protein [Pseudomonadota bacterium]